MFLFAGCGITHSYGFYCADVIKLSELCPLTFFMGTDKEDWYILKLSYRAFHREAVFFCSLLFQCFPFWPTSIISYWHSGSSITRQANLWHSVPRINIVLLGFLIPAFQKTGKKKEKQEYDQGDSNLRMIPLQSELGENATTILRIKMSWVKVTQ